MLKHSLLSASLAAIALPLVAFAQTAEDQPATSPTTSQDRTHDSRTMSGQDRTGVGETQTPRQDPYGTRATTGEDLNRTEPAAGQDNMRGQTDRAGQTRAVDMKTIASGHRASKLIGRDIVNEANETVGKIDDLVITRDDRVLYAIVSVGGFLGMGERLVAVPYDDLAMRGDNFVMRDATKDSLKQRPEFKYQN